MTFKEKEKKYNHNLNQSIFNSTAKPASISDSIAIHFDSTRGAIVFSSRKNAIVKRPGLVKRKGPKLVPNSQ